MATDKAIRNTLLSFQVIYRERFPLPGAQDTAQWELLTGIWRRALRHFTDRVVSAAVNLTLEEMQYPPTPADVVSRCWKFAAPLFPTPGEAWGQVTHELNRGVSEFNHPVFTIDLVDDIVQAWGWRMFVDAFRAVDRKELSILQARFQDEYQVRVRRFNDGLAQTGHEWDIAEDVPRLPQPSESPRQPQAANTPDDYVDVRLPVVDAEMEAIRFHIRSKPVLKAIFDRAKAEMETLLAQVRTARQQGDYEAEQRALAAIKEYCSIKTQRAEQVEFLEAVRSGLSEELLRWPKVCETCQGQRTIQVYYNQAPPDRMNWVKIGNPSPVTFDKRYRFRQLYQCPRCVTPSVTHRAAEIETVYQAVTPKTPARPSVSVSTTDIYNAPTIIAA